MTKPLDPIEATTASHAGKPERAADTDRGACANCGATLSGEYCHDCGQYAHNPLSSFRHAVEDVFESVWHLDGRIFRTLRLLFVPGRVAREYMAGHRVRFIPPLRLFVVLSLLTFFVGQLVLHVGEGVRMEGVENEFRNAQTVEEVERIRDRLLVPIEEAEREMKDSKAVGASPALVAARVRIQGQAASRIAALREQAERPRPTAKPAADAGGNADDGRRTPDGDAPGVAKVTVSPLAQDDDDDASVRCKFNDHVFDAKTNPVEVAWLPGFGERWFNARIGRACDNLKDIENSGERLFQQFLGAIPTALFLLMPLFALLLKILYLGSGRGYLEHLVVALYSHCFLLLMLMLMFVLSAGSNAGAPAWLTGLGYSAIWIWMPIYLWMMQRRVYGGGWFSNLVRYLLIGTTYIVLVTFATLYAALVGLSS
jgi:hypothetical protein